MDDDLVIRFAPTYVDKDGTRTLMRADGDTATFASREEAQAWLDAMLQAIGPARTRARWGSNPRFDVRTCRCRSSDLVPQEIYFECW